MPQVGEVVALNMKLFDENDSLFVRAIVRDDVGAQVTGSPFNLPNVGNGQYQLDTFTMPSGTSFLTVGYRVFEDAGFTIHAEPYTDGVDKFTLDIPDATILSLLQDIKDVVDQILAQAPASLDITALIEEPDESIFGILDNDENTMESVVAEDDQIADVIQENDKVISNVNEDDDHVIGVVEELP